MIRDDYIMRMIEQFTIAITKILFNKNIKNHEKFIIQLDNLSSQFIGLDLKMLHSLSTEEIIPLFTINNNLDSSSCFITAEMKKD